MVFVTDEHNMTSTVNWAFRWCAIVLHRLLKQFYLFLFFFGALLGCIQHEHEWFNSDIADSTWHRLSWKLSRAAWICLSSTVASKHAFGTLTVDLPFHKNRSSMQSIWKGKHQQSFKEVESNARRKYFCEACCHCWIGFVLALFHTRRMDHVRVSDAYGYTCSVPVACAPTTLKTTATVASHIIL